MTRFHSFFVVVVVVIDQEAFDSRAGVKSFDHSKLKHVTTEEKNPLPTTQGKSGVSQLRVLHGKSPPPPPPPPLLSLFPFPLSLMLITQFVLTHKYVTLSAVEIRAEMMPDSLPDRSEVEKFDKEQKLKHVVTTEKSMLPTQEGAEELCLLPRKCTH